MELNNEVWCKLAPSPLHGVGVFAVRDILKGQKLYCQSWGRIQFCTEPIDSLLPEIQELILQRWPHAPKYPYISPNEDARLLSFMNDGGNESNYDPSLDVALRDIKKGEEVLEDYSYPLDSKPE